MNKEQSGAPLPLFLETSLTLSRFLVLAAGTATVLVSLRSGAPLWMTALRGGGALLSVGLILWLANWALAKNALDAALADLQKKAAERKQLEEVDAAERTLDLSA